jgi:hypothetical protein
MLTVGLLIVSVVMVSLLPALVMTSYQENNIVVSPSVKDKTISFSMSTSTDTPPIYGFIITSINHGHYSKVVNSPDGWTPGNIKYHVAMWTTNDRPIQPGTTEDDFATEVRRAGTYEIRWTALDSNFKPVQWGIMTVTV